MSRTTLCRLVVSGAAALSLMLLAPASGQATTITSAGPLTEIIISPDLNCQVRYANETSFSFFSPSSPVGTCGTYIARGSQVFSPGGYVQISQSEVPAGSGTADDPYHVVTQVCAGTFDECSANTAPLVTTDVRYVTGEDFFRTDVQITRRGASETVGIYQYADCYLQESDSGYGFIDASTGGVYCSRTANNTPADRIEGFVPINPGSSYYEAFYSTVRFQVASGGAAPLPNVCECATLQDNGMALAWTGITLPASGSVRRSFLTAFSPAGVVPDPAPTVTLSSPAPGSQSTDTTPTYSGVAGDQPGDSPTVTVEVYAGSVIPETPALSTLTATRTGAEWRVTDPSPLAPGTYTARARQTDEAGNEGISNPSCLLYTSPSPRD